jgi:hypothetical protein
MPLVCNTQLKMGLCREKLNASIILQLHSYLKPNVECKEHCIIKLSGL